MVESMPITLIELYVTHYLILTLVGSSSVPVYFKDGIPMEATDIPSGGNGSGITSIMSSGREDLAEESDLADGMLYAWIPVGDLERLYLGIEGNPVLIKSNEYNIRAGSSDDSGGNVYLDVADNTADSATGTNTIQTAKYGKYYTATAVAADGYDLVGWTDTESGSGKLVSSNETISKKVTTNVTLKANFIITSKDGYVFDAWYDDAGNVVNTNSIFSFKATKDRNLTARFSSLAVEKGRRTPYIYGYTEKGDTSSFVFISSVMSSSNLKSMGAIVIGTTKKMETPPADVFKDLEGTTVITGKADSYNEYASTIITTKDQFRIYGMAFATYYVTIDGYMGLTGEYDSVLTAVQGLYDNGATFYTVNSRKKFSVATISRPDENTDVSSYGTKYYVEYTYYGNTVDRLDVE